MAAGFAITITAVDAASARIEAINKRLAAMRAPVERIQRQLATFSRLSGLQSVARGFQRMAQGAYAAFQSIARIVAPLSAITGAASIAGMYKLVDVWGDWGRQLLYTSQLIGIPVEKLNALEGAAALAGASAGAMASSLQGLSQTMYDAIGGRNSEALGMFMQLGIAIDDGSRHAISADAAFRKLADSVASTTNPMTQLRIATRAGIDPSLLPLLRKGSRGVDEYLAQVAKYAPTTAAGIEAAKQFAEAQGRLTLSVQGFGNAISERLAPIIGPLLDQMANWIALNRGWIAQDIGDRVKQLADWVSQIDFRAVGAQLTGMLHTADNLAHAFGGWKTILEGIVAIKLAGWALSAIGPLTGVLRLLAFIPGSGVTAGALAAAGFAAEVNSRSAAINFGRGRGRTADQAAGDYVAGVSGVNLPDRPGSGPADGGWGGQLYRWITGTQTDVSKGDTSAAMRAFKAMGYPSNASAGIAAGLYDESKLDPRAVGDNGQAYGIGQWHPDRQAYFKRLFGHDIRKSNLAEQMQFVNEELHSTEAAARRSLMDAGSSYDAGYNFRHDYERPRDLSESERTGRLADQLADATPAAGAQGASGKVDLHVKFSGGPAIQSTTARTTGNVNPPKIASSQVGGDSGV